MKFRDQPGPLQESEYEFPYHHIPYFDGRGLLRTARELHWGREYFDCLAAVIEAISPSESMSILDVGCGDGKLSAILRSRVREIVGIDTSRRAIDLARAMVPGVKFECMDLANIDRKFDAIVANEVLEHIPDAEITNFVASIASALRQGGRAILAVPSINKRLSTKHYRHYDEGALRTHAQQGGLLIESLRWVVKRNRALSFLNRLLHNKLWSIHLPAFEGWAWRKAQDGCQATSRDGLHIVAICRKADEQSA